MAKFPEKIREETEDGGNDKAEADAKEKKTAKDCSEFFEKSGELYEDLMKAQSTMNVNCSGPFTWIMIWLTVHAIYHGAFGMYGRSARFSPVFSAITAFFIFVASLSFLFFTGSVGDAQNAASSRFYHPKALQELNRMLQSSATNMGTTLEYVEKLEAMDVGFKFINVTMTKYKVVYFLFAGLFAYITVVSSGVVY